VPVLPFDTLLQYENVLPLHNSVKLEHDSEGDTHQLYTDMLGWKEMAKTVAAVYHSLPSSDRTRCGILAGNYGEAGAIDLFGPEYGLPGAISAHNNYYLWGPHGHTGDIVILFGQHAESTKQAFSEVEQAAMISGRPTAISENSLPVYICRRPKSSAAGALAVAKIHRVAPFRIKAVGESCAILRAVLNKAMASRRGGSSGVVWDSRYLSRSAWASSRFRLF